MKRIQCFIVIVVLTLSLATNLEAKPTKLCTVSVALLTSVLNFTSPSVAAPLVPGTSLSKELYRGVQQTHDQVENWLYFDIDFRDRELVFTDFDQPLTKNTGSEWVQIAGEWNSKVIIENFGPPPVEASGEILYLLDETPNTPGVYQDTIILFIAGEAHITHRVWILNDAFDLDLGLRGIDETSLAPQHEVRRVPPIPEPHSLALLLAGGIPLLMKRGSR